MWSFYEYVNVTSLNFRTAKLTLKASGMAYFSGCFCTTKWHLKTQNRTWSGTYDFVNWKSWNTSVNTWNWQASVGCIDCCNVDMYQHTSRTFLNSKVKDNFITPTTYCPSKNVSRHALDAFNREEHLCLILQPTIQITPHCPYRILSMTSSPN